MDRAGLLERLRLAKRHVSSGERIIISQRALIERMQRGGHSVEKARELLRLFEAVQVIFVADRDRLAAEATRTSSST